MAGIVKVDISVTHNLFVDEKGLCADKIIKIVVQPIVAQKFIELTITPTYNGRN